MNSTKVSAKDLEMERIQKLNEEMKAELAKYRAKRVKYDETDDSQSSFGNSSVSTQDLSFGGSSSTQDLGLTQMFNADVSVSQNDDTIDLPSGRVDYFTDDFHLSEDLLNESSQKPKDEKKAKGTTAETNKE